MAGLQLRKQREAHAASDRVVSGSGRRAAASLMAFPAVTAFVASVVMGVFAVFVPSVSARPTAYVANFFVDTLSAYSVASDGGLSPVAGSPFATGIAPLAVAMTPDSRYLYAGNFESGNVSAYSVASDGSLTPVAGSPFHTGTWPWGVAVSPDGEHLFVSNNGSDSISAYSVASDGSLSPVAGSPFATESGARSNGVAVTPDGNYLYVPSGDRHSVVAFSVASDGSLSPISGSPFEAGPTPREVSVTPDGKYLYVSNVSGGTISAYSIASDGSLSPVAGSPFTTEGAPQSLVVTPDGKYLYVSHVGGTNTVWGYSISSHGSLSPVVDAPFATGIKTGGVGVSPDGKHLYVTGGTKSVLAYSIASNGGLSPVTGSPFEAGNGAVWGAVTLDQGPLAAFSATPTPAGNASSFNASSSSDPDGTVASYRWNFGDGQTQVTSTATTSHLYASAGDFTVTLRVTDNAGCSTAQIFTGQTVSCNGSLLAQISQEISVQSGVPLSVSLLGSGSGSVASSPSGVACPGECSYYYVPGTEVKLAASAAPGSIFTGWTGGGCSGTEACQVTMDANAEVAADFSKVPIPPTKTSTHTLTVEIVGNGRGGVEDGTRAILCPLACSHSYAAGTQVTLTAKPASGTRFAGWSGSGCAGPGTCRFTIDADTALTANFERIPPVPARLEIDRVGWRPVRPACATTLALVPRPLGLICPKVKLVVVGKINKQAHGAIGVNVSTTLHGRRVTASEGARIRDGRWRTRLVLTGLARSSSAPFYVTARFGGSLGVRSGYVKHYVGLKR